MALRYHWAVATTAQLLQEARDAYHRLVTGRATTVVAGPAGERVEYARADAGRLAAYIKTLEAEASGVTRRSLAPISFHF